MTITEKQKIFKENLNLALNLQNNGKFQEAEKIYNNLLEKYPDNYDILNLLGVLSFQTKKYTEAIKYITKAIEIKPAAVSYNNLGHSLTAIKDLDKAICAYQKALELNPDSIETYFSLIRIFQEKKETDKAIFYYQQIIKINPDNAEAYNNLGLIFRGENNFNDAINCYKKALEINPTYLKAIFNLANVLRAANNFDEAIKYYYKAMELNPEFEEAYNNLGTVFNEKNEKNKAILNYKKAIEINPEFVDAYCNLAMVLKEQGKIDEALSWCYKAIVINPDNAEVYNKIGVILYYEKRFEEALNWYEKAVNLKPDSEEFHFNLGSTQILLENLEDGWENYDYRHFKNIKQKLKIESFKQPLWKGESLQNKTIYTYYEQGLGDSIQFVRYLPILKEMGTKVLFKAQTSLIELFKQNYPDIEILDESIQDKTLNFDLFSPILSLPGALKTNINNIPETKKYLKADPEKRNYYKEKIASSHLTDAPLNDSYNKFKLGIVWQGSHTNKNDKNRSVSLDFFSEIAKLENINLYSLQKGVGEEQIEKSSLNIINLGSSFNDFSDTAAAIENLDLVICVDTAVAHLSGALGIPTWILIPYIPCWRWFTERTDSPWYDSVKLFRQKEPGNWNEVKDRVLKAISTIL